MDKVTLDGKVYERSAVVAKRFGYTADYLGQLSRSGKIDAQLVGRSWYVHSDSVLAYKNGVVDESAKGKSLPAKKPTTKASDSFTVAIRKDVSTPARESIGEQNEASTKQKKLTIITTRHIQPRNTEIQSKISISRQDNTNGFGDKKTTIPDVGRKEALPHWSRIAYQEDDAELLPTVQKNNTKSNNAVMCGESDENITTKNAKSAHLEERRLRIHSNSAQYSIVSSGLPEVRLRGSITLSEPEESAMTADYSEKTGTVTKRIGSLRTQKQVSTPVKFVKRILLEDAKADSASRPIVKNEQIALDAKSNTTRLPLYTKYRIFIFIVFVIFLLYIILSLGVEMSYSEASHSMERSWYIKSPGYILNIF